MKGKTLNLILFFCCVLFATTVSAEGKDVLAGLMPDVRSTINGSGKYLMYAGEIVTATGSYIKSKNIYTLGGIIILSLFFNFGLGLV